MNPEKNRILINITIEETDKNHIKYVILVMTVCGFPLNEGITGPYVKKSCWEGSHLKLLIKRVTTSCALKTAS